MFLMKFYIVHLRKVEYTAYIEYKLNTEWSPLVKIMYSVYKLSTEGYNSAQSHAWWLQIILYPKPQNTW